MYLLQLAVLPSILFILASSVSSDVLYMGQGPKLPNKVGLVFGTPTGPFEVEPPILMNQEQDDYKQCELLLKLAE